MASSSKRTRLTEREQQTLLEDFLNNLDNPDAPGNIDPYEDVDNILDNEQDENVQEIIVDATENANENEDTEGEEPRRQKFKNLSEVLDEANYDPLPPQPKRTYKYQTKEMEKKGLSTKWTTHKSMDNSEIEDDEEEDVVVPVVRRREPPGKRRASNIVQEEPGPCAEAKGLEQPSEFWSLFFTDQILQVIVDFTNQSIERWITVNGDRITSKHTYVKKT